MARRKDVFQSKVLHRLYHKAQTEEIQPRLINVMTTLGSEPALKRKPLQNSVKDDSKSSSSGSIEPGLRVYTATPPPADHQASGLEAGESSDEADQEDDAHRKRRRRRRGGGGAKKEPAPPSSGDAPRESPIDRRPSENRRRTLKKRRRRERLRSLGLAPPAAALEFTYRREGEGQEAGPGAADGAVAQECCGDVSM